MQLPATSDAQAGMAIENAQDISMFKSPGTAKLLAMRKLGGFKQEERPRLRPRPATKTLADLTKAPSYASHRQLQAQNQINNQPHSSSGSKTRRPSTQTREPQRGGYKENKAGFQSRESTVDRHVGKNKRPSIRSRHSSENNTFHSILSRTKTSHRRKRRASDPEVSDLNAAQEDIELQRYQVNFPKATPPSHMHASITEEEVQFLKSLARMLSVSRAPKLQDYSQYVRESLTLKGGKGSGRKQVPYAFHLLHNNRTANGSTKKMAIQAVASMILKRFKTKQRLTSNR